MLLGRFQPAFNVAAPLGGFVCAGEIVVGFQLGIDAIENSQCMRLECSQVGRRHHASDFDAQRWQIIRRLCYGLRCNWLWLIIGQILLELRPACGDFLCQCRIGFVPKVFCGLCQLVAVPL